MRLVRDPHQEMILVYELVAAAQDTEPSTLVFEWGRTSSRLTSYPSDWRSLKDDELLALRRGQS